MGGAGEDGGQDLIFAIGNYNIYTLILAIPEFRGGLFD